jgi:hypothetical protein
MRPVKILGMMKKKAREVFVVQFREDTTSYVVTREALEKSYPNEQTTFYEQDVKFV